MKKTKIALAAIAVLAAVMTVKAEEAVSFESLYKAPVVDSGIEVPAPQAPKAVIYRFESIAGCQVVNNLFIMQPAMKDALSMLKHCSDGLKDAYGVPVTFTAANFNGSAGIEIGVGNSAAALATVKEGVIRKGGSFFGYPVKIKKLESAAAAKVVFPGKSRIDCEILVAGRRNILSFAVTGLGGPGAELLSLNPGDDYAPIIEGKDNHDIRSMNDQGGELRADEKTLVLVGDGDGCSYVRLVLFKNSGYTRGWASESGSETPNWYTADVTCSVKAL